MRFLSRDLSREKNHGTLQVAAEITSFQHKDYPIMGTIARVPEFCCTSQLNYFVFSDAGDVFDAGAGMFII